MSYIILSADCKGSRIEFMEKGGEYWEKPTSKLFTGVLALQTFDDRDYMRITFADGKNVYGAAIKKLFGTAKAIYDGKPFTAYKKGNADYLCHFDFSKEDISSGKKKLVYSIQIIGLQAVHILACYDFSDYTGCAYMLPNKEEAAKWTKQLGITEVVYLDEDGKISSREPL